MTNYYFLASLLPELTVGSPPDLSFHELDKMLGANLTKMDQEQLSVLRCLYDLENMRVLWKGEENFLPYGCYPPADLEEALLTRSGLPDYVYDFFERYDEVADRLRHYPALLSTYFSQEIPKATGFLCEYLVFEREWRLVAAAYRAKRLGRDLTVELQYEDPNDSLVGQMLAQKDAPNFEPPHGFDRLVSLIETYYDDPMEMHKALCEYRFRAFQGLAENDFFGIDRILSYLARLIIVEEWLDLDKEKGLAFIDGIEKKKG